MGVFSSAHGGRRKALSPGLLLVIYCLVIVAASLLGGALPSLMRLTHKRMQTIISFVAGLMLGISLFHMLPHSAAQTGSLDRSIAWMVAGLLAMFFLIRAFHFHQHEPHEAGAHGDHGHGPPAQLGWVGIAIGMSLHTAIDGVALASSVAAESQAEHSFALLGFGTFLVVLLHKPLDALSITTVMTAERWSMRSRQLVNLGFAKMVPVGAALFYLGLSTSGQGADANFVGCALAFSAGAFLVIALSDLLPELQFHAHDRIRLSVALLLGVALAYGLGFLESEAVHGHH